MSIVGSYLFVDKIEERGCVATDHGLGVFEAYHKDGLSHNTYSGPLDSLASFALSVQEQGVHHRSDPCYHHIYALAFVTAVSFLLNA